MNSATMTERPKPPSKPGRPGETISDGGRRIVVAQKTDIVDDVQVILSIEDSEELRNRLRASKRAIDSEFFVFAGLLARAFEIGAHKNWGYKTWKEYVETDLGMSVRKAQYLLQLWQWFALEIKNPGVREKVKALGWTKAKELVGVCTEENVDEWIEIASNLSVKDLAKRVKEAIQSIDGDMAGEDEPARTFSCKLVGEQWDNVQRALAIAEEVAGSDKKGHLLDLIATDFVTNNVFPNNPDDETATRYLAKFESLLGVRMIAVNAKSLDIVFGEDTLRYILQARPSDEQ